MAGGWEPSMDGAGQEGEGTFHRGERAGGQETFKAGSVDRESFREVSELGDSEPHLKGQDSGDRKHSMPRKEEDRETQLEGQAGRENGNKEPFMERSGQLDSKPSMQGAGGRGQGAGKGTHLEQAREETDLPMKRAGQRDRDPNFDREGKGGEGTLHGWGRTGGQGTSL